MRRRPPASLALAGWLLGITGLASAWLAPAALAAAPKQRLVQKRYVQVTTGSSVGVTLKKANAAGNLIVAYVVWDGGGAATLADSRGNGYASAVGPSDAADGTRSQIFYAGNVAAGANTIT